MCHGVWLGDEVKNFFIKDVMETRSSQCGFICNWSKYKNIWVKGLLV